MTNKARNLNMIDDIIPPDEFLKKSTAGNITSLFFIISILFTVQKIIPKYNYYNP